MTGSSSQNLNKVTVTVTDMQQHKSEQQTVGFISSTRFLFFKFNFVHGWLMKKRAVADTVHGKVQAIHCIPYQKTQSKDKSVSILSQA